MTGKHAIRRRDAKWIVFYGIDYETPLRVVAETDKQILLHKRSLTSWSGVGWRDTKPARYMLANKLPDNWIDIIREEEPGTKWRACVKEMTAAMAVSS